MSPPRSINEPAFEAPRNADNLESRLKTAAIAVRRGDRRETCQSILLRTLYDDEPLWRINSVFFKITGFNRNRTAAFGQVDASTRRMVWFSLLVPSDGNVDNGPRHGRRRIVWPRSCERRDVIEVRRQSEYVDR